MRNSPDIRGGPSAPGDGVDSDLLDDLPFFALLALIVALGVCLIVLLPPNKDVAWYLYAAGRLLDGGELCVDVVEVNPPLVLFLSQFAVGTARFIGCSSLVVYPAFTLALVALSLGLCWRQSGGLRKRLRRAEMLAWAYVLLIHSGPMFGQREHLTVILLLPYLYGVAALAAGRDVPRGTQIVSGLMAGIGFALKPFFVPAVIAVEWYFNSRRTGRTWLRPQVVMIALVFLVYGGVLCALVPEYLVFARTHFDLYRAYQPYGELLLPIPNSWRLGLVILGVLVAWRQVEREAAALAGVLSITSAMMAIAALLQGKGWWYHWYPAVAFAGVLLAARAADRFSHWKGRPRWLTLSLAAALVVGLFCSWTAGFWLRCLPRQTAMEAFVCREAGQQPILALSSYMGSGFPLVNQAGVEWGSRYPTLWQIPGFYPNHAWSPDRYRSLTEMSERERAFVQSVVFDMQRSRPGLLLVDKCPPTPAMIGFDYVTYFSCHPEFRRQYEQYERWTETPRYVIYKQHPEVHFSTHY